MGVVVVRPICGRHVAAISPTLHQQVHQMIAELVLHVYSHPETLAAKDASLAIKIEVSVLELVRTFLLELFVQQLHSML